ncbi:MAG: hypothetical protein EON58_19030 [Alphaproteobacteria bacterium]|nr:MAG: hypothetical protein EON58_19030 [Alphaproteobacteria bacterium]
MTGPQEVTAEQRRINRLKLYAFIGVIVALIVFMVVQCSHKLEPFHQQPITPLSSTDLQAQKQAIERDIARDTPATLNHSTISDMSPQEQNTIDDKPIAGAKQGQSPASTQNPERQVFTRNCLESLTKGKEPAVMSVSQADREAMCAAMYTER